MFFRLRSKPTKLSFSLTIIFIGVILLIDGLHYVHIIKKAPVDIMSTDIGAIKKNMHVTMDVNFVWDEIISETTSYTTLGITTSKQESARYYAIPYLYTMEDEGKKNVAPYTDYFILLKADSLYFDEMDALIAQTYEWYEAWLDAYNNGKPLPAPPKKEISIDGYIKKLSEKESSVVRDYLRMAKYETDADHPSLDDYYSPYYIVPIGNPSFYYGTVRVGVALLAIGIAFLAYEIYLHRKKQSKASTYAQIYRNQYGNRSGNQYGNQSGNQYGNSYGNLYEGVGFEGFDEFQTNETTDDTPK